MDMQTYASTCQKPTSASLDALIIDWQIRNLPPNHHRPKRIKPLHELAGEYGRLRWDWPAGFGYKQVYLRRKE
jgi:hypothetical protein